MRNRKRYFANVSEDMVDYFESKLAQLGDGIHHVEREFREASDGCEVFMRYIITADEGLINPEYELKTEEDI